MDVSYGGGNGGSGSGGGGSWDTSGQWQYEAPHGVVPYRTGSQGEAVERPNYLGVERPNYSGGQGGSVYRSGGVTERSMAEACTHSGAGGGAGSRDAGGSVCRDAGAKIQWLAPSGLYPPPRGGAAPTASADNRSQLTNGSGRSDHRSTPAGVGARSPPDGGCRGQGGVVSPPQPVWSNPEPSSTPLVAMGDGAGGASTDGSGAQRGYVEDSQSRPCCGEEGDGSEQATRGGGASGVAKDAEYLRALGFQLCRAGRFEEAVVQYEHSIAALPFTRGYPVLGDKSAALLVLGRWREALADAEAATTWALKAHHLYEVEKGLYMQGQALLCLQRPHKAVLAFQQCLALRPANATGQRALMEALRAAEAEDARAMAADAEGDRVVVQSTSGAAGADAHAQAMADNSHLPNSGHNHTKEGGYDRTKEGGYDRTKEGGYDRGDGGAGSPYVGVPCAYGDASVLPATVLAAAHTVTAGQRLFEEEPILLVPAYPSRAWLARNPKYKKVREICRRCQLDEILARAVMEFQALPEASQHKVVQLGGPPPPPPGAPTRGSGSAGRRLGCKIWHGDLGPELAELLGLEPALLEKLLTIFHSQSAMTEDGSFMALHELYPSLLHSCTPNCQAFCGRLPVGGTPHQGDAGASPPPASSPGGMRVVALTTIPRGAVLTVSYLSDDDLLSCTERRQRRLVENRGAPCRCMRCLRPDKARVFICQACCSPSVLAPPPVLVDLWRTEGSAHGSMSGTAAATNGDSSRAGASGGQPGGGAPSPAGAPGGARAAGVGGASGGLGGTGDGSVPSTPLRSECDSAGTSTGEGQPFVCLKCNKHVEGATVSLMLQQERELRQHISNLERRRFMPFAQPVLTLLALAERSLVSEQHWLVAALHEIAYERAAGDGDLGTAGRHLFKCIEYAKAVHPGTLLKTAQHKEALGDILAGQLAAEPEPQRHETRLLAAQLFQSACADLSILRGKAHPDYQKASRKLFDLLISKEMPSGSQGGAADRGKTI